MLYVRVDLDKNYLKQVKDLSRRAELEAEIEKMQSLLPIGSYCKYTEISPSSPRGFSAVDGPTRQTRSRPTDRFAYYHPIARVANYWIMQAGQHLGVCVGLELLDMSERYHNCHTKIHFDQHIKTLDKADFLQYLTDPEECVRVYAEQAYKLAFK